MLIVECQDYFKKVEEEVHATRDSELITAFNNAMVHCHLFGCDWEEPFRAVVELHNDFAPWSFFFVEWLVCKPEYKPSDEEVRNGKCKEFFDKWYVRYMHGGLIYQGPKCPADGSFPSLTVSLDPTRIGWFMHT